ncbi:MAG: hypothetical protein AAFP02_10205, partial [Bacteroidota bacterium]
MKVLSKEQIEEVRSVIVLLKAIKRDLKEIDFSDAFLEGQLTVMHFFNLFFAENFHFSLQWTID